jgi:FlaA1/EpsC-like NDP-sugar epimerase
MSDDAIRTVLLVLMGLTSIATLSFPIMFSRYEWRKSAIGRALMIKSASTAASVTATFLVSLLRPAIEVRFAVYVICFGAIMITSARLTWTMLAINNEERVIAPVKKDEAPK